MNRQVLSILTSTHELADVMEKAIILYSQTNVQIYCNAAFTNLTKEQFQCLYSKDLPILFCLDTIRSLKVHIPNPDGTLLMNQISKGFSSNKKLLERKKKRRWKKAPHNLTEIRFHYKQSLCCFNFFIRYVHLPQALFTETHLIQADCIFKAILDCQWHYCRELIL